MARLIIEGDERLLNTIARENRLRSSKYGLKISFEKQNQKAPEKEVEKEPSVKESEAKKAVTKTKGKAKK